VTLSHETRFTIEKLQRRIDLLTPLIYRKSAPIPPFRIKSLESPLTPPPLHEDDSSWDVIQPKDYWGYKNLNFALSSSFTIPADFDPQSPVMLVLPLGVAGDFDHPEALIYVDGEAYAGCDRNHQAIKLRDEWRDGKTRKILLHGWCGLMGGTAVEAGRKLYMGQPAVVQVDQPLREFVVLARNVLQVARHSDVQNPARDRLLNALDMAFKQVDLREKYGDPLQASDTLYASIAAAHETLRAEIAKAGAPLDVHIHATGHAHIDTAWLWTVDQTRRKAERTFSTVLRLMEEFPEYRFVQSQPQLYDFIRQDQPEVFAQIKQRIAEGRWEAIGGMWIESDCNIPGGESLVRQFLLGRRFFRDQFGEGAESPVLWLPDVFGYAWNLPQLIKQAGLEYFFTIKIGWNQYNRLPYDTFWWQGLDGTKVLTHFSTSPEHHDIRSKGTYNVEADGLTAVGTWINVQQKHIVKDILMSYGWGDGGGGPTREMIENIRVLGDMPASPQVKQSRVIDFFRHVEATTGNQLPTWNGELYLEMHRGTYTTQARNKRANRQSEFLLHDAEFAATVASLLDKDYAYPHETFRKAWELVCLNQFHDIIPGSSIGEVYVDSARDYAEIRHLAETARDAALEVLAAVLGSTRIAVNPSTVAQNIDYSLADAEPFSFYALLDDDDIAAEVDPSLAVKTSPSVLENGLIRVEFDPAGNITRIYDEFADREVLPAGTIANQWIAYEDRPNNWGAWDVDIFHDEKHWTSDPATSITVIEATPRRGTLEIRRRILHSDYVQRISLAAGSTTLEFDTTIDWRDRHALLKAAFPVDVLATKATFEIQFGNVERPTHTNTSWDWARFETCAQKWVHLGEQDFGVGLINNGKYGHRIHDNTIYLSLLRGSTSPDPTADVGTHQFKYALVIGENAVKTAAEAYALNDPVFTFTSQQAIPNADEALSFTLLRKHELNPSESFIIETIKRAEDNRGIIVRGYESARTRETVELEFGFDVGAAYQSTILEVDGAPLNVENGQAVRFSVKPFEIVTLRIIPADEV